MGMRVFDDFESDDGPDRRARHYIARPMHVVVHPRNPNQGRATVKHRAHVKSCMWPPELRFAGYSRREGERGHRVARGERSILIAGKASPQLEVIRILDVGERPLSAGHEFDSAAKYVVQQD